MKRTALCTWYPLCTPLQAFCAPLSCSAALCCHAFGTSSQPTQPQDIGQFRSLVASFSQAPAPCSTGMEACNHRPTLAHTPQSASAVNSAQLIRGTVSSQALKRRFSRSAHMHKQNTTHRITGSTGLRTPPTPRAKRPRDGLLSCCGAPLCPSLLSTMRWSYPTTTTMQGNAA